MLDKHFSIYSTFSLASTANLDLTLSAHDWPGLWKLDSRVWWATFLSISKHADVGKLQRFCEHLQLPSNYAPINLLSDLSKIADAITHDNLRDAVSVANLLPDESFTSTKDLSGDFQLLRFTEEVHNVLELRYLIGTVFLNYAYAIYSSCAWQFTISNEMVRY